MTQECYNALSSFLDIIKTVMDREEECRLAAMRREMTFHANSTRCKLTRAVSPLALHCVSVGDSDDESSGEEVVIRSNSVDAVFHENAQPDLMRRCASEGRLTEGLK